MEAILDLAKEAVENRDRRPPNVVHRRIAAMRDIETPAIDNLVDIAGYARCVELMRTPLSKGVSNA